ncbi:MAG TPA: universal stress protein [Solirubrobacteraceae bacterium]|jgi:nucleotide-binding universal stress UspA family protein
MSVFERIVVGVDHRAGGRDALALAGLLQRACGGEVLAAHVYQYDRSVRLDRADAMEITLHDDLVAELKAELVRADVAARVTVVADPSPARALHAIAERERADLIVVGAPHRTGADRMLGGDAAASTLHAAPCAVAVAPAGFAERKRTLAAVGVGFDDSPEARDALALARRVARAAGARLHALCVAVPAIPLWPVPALDPESPGFEAALRDRGRYELESARVELEAEGDAEVIVGSPAHELARRSRQLDLLVVGSRSHGAIGRLLLGSTSTRLVHEAACPLLVLPRCGAARAEDPSDAAAAAS